MGPQSISMPGTPLTWVVLTLTLMIGAMLAYEIAVAEPKPFRWPGWLVQTVKFIYRWYPRVVVPLLIALGWLWL